MNLCFICREYPPAPRTGGIGSATHEQARSLARLGHGVHVVAPAWDRSGVFEDEGTVVHRVPVPRSQVPGIVRYVGQTLERLAWSWAAARAVWHLDRHRGIDVVEAPEFAAEGFVASRRTHPPVVVRLHTPLALVRRLNDAPLRPDCRRTVRLERAALEQAAMVTAPSRAVAFACAAAGYGRPAASARIVPHGIDTSTFSPAPPEGPGSEEPMVLFCGRLEARKGMGALTRALPAIAGRVPRARFVFVGADTRTAPGGRSWTEVLLVRARQAGMEDRVRVVGFVPREELPDWYRAAQVVVTPSPFEAFGLVYLEALACGRPVVGCASGAFPELVTDGCEGRVVPPKDPEALAEAVVGLLEHPAEAEAMGERARDRAEAGFALERVATQTAELYASVARGREVA